MTLQCHQQTATVMNEDVNSTFLLSKYLRASFENLQVDGDKQKKASDSAVSSVSAIYIRF